MLKPERSLLGSWREGWQQLCCARVLRVKAKVLRRPWRDRALPEKRNRFLPVDEVKEEGAISRVYDTEMTVLVTDLKGFTSTTKKHGIIHFASIIIRKRQLCLPILHRYKAAHITTEADNLIVAFPSACDAARAALELRAAIQKTNATLEEAKAHFAIQLNGVGIHCGVGLMQSAEGELLGEVARGAYVLGEDLCKGSEILVSEAVRLKLQEDPFFASASFNSREDQETTGAIDFSYFELGGDWKDLQVDLASTEDQSFLHPSLLPLAQRHGKSGVELMMLDEAIHKHLRPQTVLMFSIDSQNGSQDEAAIMQMNKSRAALRPILEQHGGWALEAELFVFDQASQAVSAALAAREAVGADAVSGFGLHLGDLLLIPETDVHWGDAVNTASKLGQDIATDQNILISAAVQQAIRESNGLGLEMEPLTVSRSNVSFQCFRISRPPPEPLEAAGQPA